jgi:drug/metabolite transporter (DMT)-like permease
MGAAAALASSFTWALTSVMLTSQSGRMRPLVMSGIRSGTASVALLALLVATGGLTQFDEVTAITVLSMAGSGIMGQAVGDTFYINALGRLGVTRSFPITNSAYPFITFVLAVVLLGEELTWTSPAGGALIVAGITWIVLEQRRGEDGAAAVPAEIMRGVVFAVLAAAAWATATVWLRGQQGNLDAIGAAAIRIPAASLAVLATLAVSAGMARASRTVPARPREPEEALPPIAGAALDAPEQRPPWRSIAVVGLAGLLGTGLGSVLFIYAVEHIGAAKTAFLTTSAPVFALPMGMIFLSERLTPRIALGTAVTVAGIWLVLA